MSMSKLLEGQLAGGPLIAVGSLTAQNIAALEGVRANVVGITTGTILIEISYNGGTSWATFATLTADGLTAELPPVGLFRARATVDTTISVEVFWGGRDNNRRA